ncbi:hypothetical protein IQ259_23200 [Fortiea sp. LEGE XX443]|uniref:hypothetical protein n=1 Tax=Fortiea sp. LEGE XX443 TaxID=1828611 RepID=UPI001882BDF8|nr:hypothetical protein [Fortiea sp. LEGE XX443]MBE9007888.1 hypothetical protein [Fortiea sp. LEGE XX443]
MTASLSAADRLALMCFFAIFTTTLYTLNFSILKAVERSLIIKGILNNNISAKP